MKRSMLLCHASDFDVANKIILIPLIAIRHVLVLYWYRLILLSKCHILEIGK